MKKIILVLILVGIFMTAVIYANVPPSSCPVISPPIITPGTIENSDDTPVSASYSIYSFGQQYRDPSATSTASSPGQNRNKDKNSAYKSALNKIGDALTDHSIDNELVESLEEAGIIEKKEYKNKKGEVTGYYYIDPKTKKEVSIYDTVSYGVVRECGGRPCQIGEEASVLTGFNVKATDGNTYSFYMDENGNPIIRYTDSDGKVVYCDQSSDGCNKFASVVQNKLCNKDACSEEEMKTASTAYQKNLKNRVFEYEAYQMSYQVYAQLGKSISNFDLAFEDYYLGNKSSILNWFPETGSYFDKMVAQKTMGFGYSWCYDHFDWYNKNFYENPNARKPEDFYNYIVDNRQDITSSFGHADWDMKFVEYIDSTNFNVNTDTHYYRVEIIIVKYDKDVDFTITYSDGSSSLDYRKVLNATYPNYRTTNPLKIFNSTTTLKKLTQICIKLNNGPVTGLEEFEESDSDGKWVECKTPDVFGTNMVIVPTTAAGTSRTSAGQSVVARGTACDDPMFMDDCTST